MLAEDEKEVVQATGKPADEERQEVAQRAPLVAVAGGADQRDEEDWAVVCVW